MRILITGGDGLIGTVLGRALVQAGHSVLSFDIRSDPARDIRSAEAVEHAVRDVDGIVHLAAVSRVIWGQKDPENCIATNAGGTRNVVEAAKKLARKKPVRAPWLIFSSSREVYGQAAALPVREDAPYKPINVYARTKVEGEQLVMAAREHGICANICRFSTVYGSRHDHADRLIPAFAAAAARGGELRLDGEQTMVDCTHVSDVCGGLLKLIPACEHGALLPPVHFVSGTGTTLPHLAEMAVRHARKPVTTRVLAGRDYDPQSFIGDPGRCRELLGWSATTPVEDGFAALVGDIAASS